MRGRPRVRAQLLGVRGSTPAPGADFVRYGGHTSCVAISADDARYPTLLLDSGTGIRSVTGLLAGSAFRGCILLSHLHWDHVQGLPFLVAADRPDSEVQVILPAQDGLSGRDLVSRFMSPPAFPITPDGLRGSWTFRTADPGTLRIGGFDVRCADLEHKGGRTFGYRISDGSGSLAYLPDHCPRRGMSRDARDLIAGVDVLLHDAQFLSTERRVADDFGHATVDDAIELAVRARVGAVVLFHHAPARTDDQLDDLATAIAGADHPMPVILAVQGETLCVRRGAVTGRRPAG
jgi:phosphoribosyl 1,2-cyclic phosphodiesterase